MDPIDGTANFTKGAKRSCVSIVYGRAGAVERGVVYDPYLDEAFSVTAGKGARLNGSPIRCEDAPMGRSIVCFGTCPYGLERAAVRRRLDWMRRRWPSVWGRSSMASRWTS